MISFQISETLKPSEPFLETISGLLIQTAESVLSAASDLVEADVAVVLTDDEQITGLNLTYLGIDAPTDVLSFPGGEKDPETGIVYLGDVIVSYPRAVVQASTGGHPIEAELQLLVVHGMLHLCGFDHAEPEEKAAMWEIQRLVLDRLGCPISGPPPVSDT